MDEMLDLDAVQDVLPWKYSVKLGGKLYQTNPPTVGQVAAMERMIRPTSKASMDDLIRCLSPLIADPSALDGMRMTQLRAFMEGYMRFFVGWQRSQLPQQQTPVPAPVPAIAEAVAKVPVTSQS